MRIARILTTALSVLAIPAMAATLDVADNLDLKVLNGKKYRASAGLFENSKTVTLPDGDNQLILQVSDSYRISDNQEIFTSEYYVITLNTEGDTALNVKAKPLPNLNAAKSFDDAPSFFLQTEAGKNYPYKMAKLTKDGMQFSRDLVEELKDFNGTGHAAALESRAPYDALIASTGLKQNSPEAQAVIRNAKAEIILSEQMLHYWFQQADQGTRERFMQWADRAMKKQAAAK